MSPSAVPPIGGRIRAERLRQGLSVRGLAREIGVSASLISQIETAKSQPSVSTLYAITTALGVSIEELFVPRHAAAAAGSPAPPGSGSADAPGRAVTAHGDGNAAAGTIAVTVAPPDPAAARGLEPNRMRRVGPVVRPDHRETLTLDSGVTWELLGQVPATRVDFLRVTYEPGGSSSSDGLLMRHSGTEYGYLMSGELVLTLGFEEHRLTAGDAISFESTTPHGYRNDGTEPAIGVWFVLEHSG